MGPLSNQLGNNASEPRRPRDRTSRSKTACMSVLAAEEVHPPPRQPLAERRQGGSRRWIPRSGTLLPTRTTPMEGATTARTMRRYWGDRTPRVRGGRLVKNVSSRARVNAEGTHRATTIVFFLLSATLLTCADVCTYMHVLTAQGADLQPEFANQSMG